MEQAIDPQLILAFGGGIAILLFMILALKVNAFISLLVSSISVGLFSGMDPVMIIDTVKKGMGNTLGFVAIIIGLGAIFGEILRQSGSTEKLSKVILEKFGLERSPLALSLSGFLIAIPVFFDVAFIILIPVIYALQKRTGKSLLYFAIPLLASLAITHAFIPPTPGPIAVADILGADLGWVILFGFIVGLPTTLVSGLWFGKYISKKIFVPVPEDMEIEKVGGDQDMDPPLGAILGLIALPIVLILANTLTAAMFPDPIEGIGQSVLKIIQFLGNPIVALIISTLFALYFLGVKMGYNKSQLQDMSIKALGPAGIIILITGAGGVFKEMLIESGAGEMLANQFARLEITPLIMAFVLALIVRLIQGSATVAMITAAGIMAPILGQMDISPIQNALLVLSIAAGASGFSHVNDSGFWLVNRYLGLSEIDTIKSWTVMTGILSITAFSIILILGLIF